MRQMRPADELIAAADRNVYQAFRERFPQDPTRLFVESFDGRRITYGEIDPITARIAGVLAAHGVSKGARVAGLLDKSPEAILLYLAVGRLGAVYIPVSTDLTPPEVEYLLQDAGPKVVVCDPRVAEAIAHVSIAGGHAKVLTLDARGQGSLIAECARMPADFPVAEGAGGDPNALVYTSGTTGKPKGAILTNGLVLWNAFALAQTWQITEDDVLLHANPMAFGLFGTTTPALAGGAALLLVPKFDAGAVLAALPRATLFSGVPTYYTRLLARNDFDETLCRNMRLFICGSAPMRADVFEEFAARSGHRLLDRYGLTEALIVTSNLVDDNRHPDTSGLPLPGSRLRVVDEVGVPVAAGDVGKIEVWQPWMFTGYWRDAEKTRSAFSADGWFLTGDFGRTDARGHVSVLGRGTDLIITGGFNVHPKEVEACLNRMPNVAESAVVGVPHRDYGEAVIAIVELADKSKSLDGAAIITSMKKELAGFKVPKRIEVVDALPRNTLGKVQKKLLKTQFATLV